MADFGISEIAILAVTIAAAGASAYGTYEQGKAQEDAAKYNQKIAENQAALAQQQADIDSDTMKEKHRRMLAEERTIEGASGTETTSGSPLLVVSDSARQMQRDIYLTKYGGAVRAGGFQQQAGLQGLYARTYGRQAEVGAGVSLLSSGARIGGQAYYGRYGSPYYA